MKIRIRNFQPFKDTAFEAEGFTAIVGPSNLGKSAAIRAIVSALFNRPGEAFVRHGAQIAQVELTDVPGRDTARLNIEWTKGHNLNRFVIDGDRYDKVGLSAPPVLFDAGFRDVWIGDKDRSKGESIRPQVAEQFDRLFLLDRPGSFISDVLSVISRLAVLLRAHKRSSSDLKSQQSILTIRRKDLDMAQVKLQSMAPISALYGRVEALAPQVDKLVADAGLVTELRGLVGRRSRVAPMAEVVIPTRTPVPLDLGEPYFSVHALVAARARVYSLATRPPVKRVIAVGAVLDEAEVVEKVTALVAERRRYAVAAGVTLPKAVSVPLAKVDLVLTRIRTIRELAAERQTALRQHFDAVASLKAITSEEEVLQAQLAEVLGGLDICPVCDRPMEVAAAATV